MDAKLRLDEKVAAAASMEISQRIFFRVPLKIGRFTIFIFKDITEDENLRLSLSRQNFLM